MKTRHFLMYITVLLHFFSFSSCKEEACPILTTAMVTDITTSSATSGGLVTYAGSGSISARGVCWNTTGSPTIDDIKTLDGEGEGSFVSNITGLIGGMKYHVRAYAINDAVTGYGNEEVFTTSSNDQQSGGQIIADHTVVDKYDDIPQYYLDQVKKMWFVIAGESHSRGYLTGLTLLEEIEPRFAVNSIMFGPTSPDPYTTVNLRASRATWGDLTNETGWIYGYGEEDWWTSETAISRTKAGITYCNTNDLKIAVIGFGHCYDSGVNYMDYCNTTQNYVDYCSERGYNTRVIFTTNTVDAPPSGTQYTRSLGADIIRAFVAADSTRILFDYADILCYDDGSNEMNTATYYEHTYQIITPTNSDKDSPYHISEVGALRLAKAIWWMLARIAGWDGGN